jgi:hypothetical protein
MIVQQLQQCLLCLIPKSVCHVHPDIKMAHEAKRWLAIVDDGVVGFQCKILQLSLSMVLLFTRQSWVVFVKLSVVE